jgi:hypothetical protein
MAEIKKINFDDQEIEVLESTDLENKIPNLKKIDDDTFEYTLIKKIYKDSKQTIPITKLTLSDPSVGRMKGFKIGDMEKLTMNDAIILVFACSDLESIAVAEKIKIKDMLNLIKSCTPFLADAQ